MLRRIFIFCAPIIRSVFVGKSQNSKKNVATKWVYCVTKYIVAPRKKTVFTLNIDFKITTFMTSSFRISSVSNGCDKLIIQIWRKNFIYFTQTNVFTWKKSVFSRNYNGRLCLEKCRRLQTMRMKFMIHFEFKSEEKKGTFYNSAQMTRQIEIMNNVWECFH